VLLPEVLVNEEFLGREGLVRGEEGLGHAVRENQRLVTNKQDGVSQGIEHTQVLVRF